MSEGTYRSKKIKDVRWNAVAKQVAGREVLVGTDVAKETMYSRLVDRGTALHVDQPLEVFETVRWENVEQLDEFISRLQALPARSITLVIEPSSTYGEPLAHQADQAGFEVAQVDGADVRKVAEVFDHVPSMHDAKAADLITRVFLMGGGRQRVKPRPDRQRLKAAGRLVKWHRDNLTPALGTLESMTAEHWPELTRILKLNSATLLAVLAEFGSPKEVARRPDEARRLMRKASRHALDERKITRVIESAGGTKGKPMYPEQVQLMRTAAAAGEQARRQKRQAERTLEKLAEDNLSAVWMGELVGKVTAAVLVGELGDPRDFHSAAGYTKMAGLNLVEDSSGKGSDRAPLRISKRGSSVARYYLFLAALRLIRDCPVTKAWYARRLQRNGGVALKGVVAVMRKLIAALYHIGAGNEYDPTKLYDINKLDLDADIEVPDEQEFTDDDSNDDEDARVYALGE